MTGQRRARGRDSHDVTVLEDAAYSPLAVDFGFTDPNDAAANALTAVMITSSRQRAA